MPKQLKYELNNSKKIYTTTDLRAMGYSRYAVDQMVATGMLVKITGSVYENTSKIEKTIHVYYADEFKPIPLTKLQQKKLDDIEDLRARAKVNSLFAKDILITELNKCGYDIEAYDNRYLIYNKVKGYNKLMKDALEYYLNNTIFKDVGCKVTLPKVKSTHKYGYNDVLCDLGNIEIV